MRSSLDAIEITAFDRKHRRDCVNRGAMMTAGKRMTMLAIIAMTLSVAFAEETPENLRPKVGRFEATAPYSILAIC
jgi:hypothetical protein